MTMISKSLWEAMALLSPYTQYFAVTTPIMLGQGIQRLLTGV